MQFDEETCAALDLLARDNVADLQELADEAFRDLLAKHGRPLGLKNQQAQSSDGADRRTQRPRIGNSVVPTKEGSRSRGETRQENQRAATAECRIDGGKAAPISLSRRYFFRRRRSGEGKPVTQMWPMWRGRACRLRQRDLAPMSPPCATDDVMRWCFG